MSNPTGSFVLTRPWHAVGTLCWREWVRFFRQRNRVVGAIGQPILFWLLFGAGMQRVFEVEGQSFQEYYFPGTMMLILLFTSIFATISIIEDRREGFLQSVLVAPVPRWAMVLGKILGATLIGVAQGLVFLLLALTMGIRFTPITGILIAFWLFLSATGLTALGFLLAWRMDSTQGFHAIMNLLLMPLWLLSGSFFPIPTLSAGAGAAQTGMHWVMRCNPVTYAVAGLRHLLYRDMESPPFSGPDGVIWTPAPSQCMLVVVVFALVMVAWAIWQARRHTAGDLK